MNEVVINGVEYVKKEANDAPIKIVILQRGWVMVGNLERTGSDCVLKNAAVVRVWGTTRGLGEIAKNGPTEKTILDKCGTVHFDWLTVVAAIDCEASKWTNAL